MAHKLSIKRNLLLKGMVDINLFFFAICNYLFLYFHDIKKIDLP